MKITCASRRSRDIRASKLGDTKSKLSRVVAADEDDDLFGDFDTVDDLEGDMPQDEYSEDDLGDVLEDVADSVEDMQDAVDEIEEDDVNIDTDNNIENHYIAECDTCHGIFISAVIESDQEIDHVSGTCPLCGKSTDQYLKWVIRSAEQA